jgi:hypothetical protein
MKKMTVGLLLVLFTISSAAWAQGRSYERTDQGQAQGQGQGHGRRMGPPPEAIAACDGQSEGAACSFETPRGDTLEGTCAQSPRGDGVACRPVNAPRGRGGPQGGNCQQMGPSQGDAERSQ